MSMFGGVPAGRGEVGETVASFPTYEAAQKAVSQLIARDVPAREIAIVGQELRSIERVTGRLGYATAARQGAINGVLLGLLFSAFIVLGQPSVPVQAFVGIVFVGIAIGMLLSLVTYSLIRRRRDFASVMQVVADRYDVTVLPSSIHRAREVFGPQSTAAPASVAAGSTPAAIPDPGTVPVPGETEPAGSPQAPPQYGERLPQPPVAGPTPTGEAPGPSGAPVPPEQSPGPAASPEPGVPVPGAGPGQEPSPGGSPVPGGSPIPGGSPVPGVLSPPVPGGPTVDGATDLGR